MVLDSSKEVAWQLPYWCVFMMLLRLIAPDLVCSCRTGRTLTTFSFSSNIPFGYSSYSGGFAGSIMTASFVLSSITKYA